MIELSEIPVGEKKPCLRENSFKPGVLFMLLLVFDFLVVQLDYLCHSPSF